MINFYNSDFIMTVVYISLGTFIIKFLFPTFVKTVDNVISSKIQHKFDKNLVDYKRTLLIKDKAEVVARLFAHINSSDLKESGDILELNYLVCKAMLWLPSEIAVKLSDLLNEGEITNKEILVDIRKLLIDEKNDLVEAKHFIRYEDDVISKPRPFFQHSKKPVGSKK
jgi:predicted nucleic-acid-binding protein